MAVFRKDKFIMLAVTETRMKRSSKDERRGGGDEWEMEW